MNDDFKEVDEEGKTLVTILMAALLFASAPNTTDEEMTIAFDTAERFTEEAIRRYG